ncbi:MAG TPA: ATP-binding protein [Candidatus Sulfotelmatobacter sp.]|nr:ATP-binding protein [Candidatus Sulfotelmatobacter sp.]
MFTLYVLPFLVVSLVLLLGFCRAQHHESEGLREELEQLQATIRQREKERDSALQELFLRFSEDGKLSKEKSQFQAKLAEYEKYAALTQLALGAAHEINNPLLGILSHLELEQKSAPSEGRHEVEQCIEAARRISVTLRSLMNYARPSPLILSKLNLHRLVAETLAFLQHQPMLHGRILENRVLTDLPNIRVDANQLSQVLMNLLLNAAQATPEGGRITVFGERSRSADSVEIRIVDTGCGIPPDVLPHVFEPFFTTKRGKGTGLGLSISQTYVRSHEGEIQVESAPNCGTTVTITLPLRQPEGAHVDGSRSEVIIQ